MSRKFGMCLIIFVMIFALANLTTAAPKPGNAASAGYLSDLTGAGSWSVACAKNLVWWKVPTNAGSAGAHAAAWDSANYKTNAVQYDYDHASDFLIPAYYNHSYEDDREQLRIADNDAKTWATNNIVNAYGSGDWFIKDTIGGLHEHHAVPVMSIDLANNTDGAHLYGFTVTVFGNSDFNPYEDLMPIYTDPSNYEESGLQIYTEKDNYSGGDFDPHNLDEYDVPVYFQLDSLNSHYHFGATSAATAHGVDVANIPVGSTNPPHCTQAGATWIPCGYQGEFVTGDATKNADWYAWQIYIEFDNPVDIHNMPPNSQIKNTRRFWVAIRPSWCCDEYDGPIDADNNAIYQADADSLESPDIAGDEFMFAMVQDLCFTTAQFAEINTNLPPYRVLSIQDYDEALGTGLTNPEWLTFGIDTRKSMLLRPRYLDSTYVAGSEASWENNNGNEDPPALWDVPGIMHGWVGIYGPVASVVDPKVTETFSRGVADTDILAGNQAAYPKVQTDSASAWNLIWDYPYTTDSLQVVSFTLKDDDNCIDYDSVYFQIDTTGDGVMDVDSIGIDSVILYVPGTGYVNPTNGVAIAAGGQRPDSYDDARDQLENWRGMADRFDAADDEPHPYSDSDRTNAHTTYNGVTLIVDTANCVDTLVFNPAFFDVDDAAATQDYTYSWRDGQIVTVRMYARDNGNNPMFKNWNSLGANSTNPAPAWIADGSATGSYVETRFAVDLSAPIAEMICPDFTDRAGEEESYIRMINGSGNNTVQLLIKDKFEVDTANSADTKLTCVNGEDFDNDADNDYSLYVHDGSIHSAYTYYTSTNMVVAPGTGVDPYNMALLVSVWNCANAGGTAFDPANFSWDTGYDDGDADDDTNPSWDGVANQVVITSIGDIDADADNANEVTISFSDTQTATLSLDLEEIFDGQGLGNAIDFSDADGMVVMVEVIDAELVDDGKAATTGPKGNDELALDAAVAATFNSDGLHDRPHILWADWTVNDNQFVMDDDGADDGDFTVPAAHNAPGSGEVSPLDPWTWTNHTVANTSDNTRNAASTAAHEAYESELTERFKFRAGETADNWDYAFANPNKHMLRDDETDSDDDGSHDAPEYTNLGSEVTVAGAGNDAIQFASDTLGWFYIDQIGPLVDLESVYPQYRFNNNAGADWEYNQAQHYYSYTSDPYQVITMDLADLSCDTYADSFAAGLDLSTVEINVKVTNADGSYHPAFGSNGKTWINPSAGTATTTGNDQDVFYYITDPTDFNTIANIVSGNYDSDNDGVSDIANATAISPQTRIVWDPRLGPKDASNILGFGSDEYKYRFRNGDKICVTVTAKDFSYSTCMNEDGGNDLINDSRSDYNANILDTVFTYRFIVDTKEPEMELSHNPNGCKNEVFELSVEDAIACSYGSCPELAAGMDSVYFEMKIFQDEGAYPQIVRFAVDPKAGAGAVTDVAEFGRINSAGSAVASWHDIYYQIMENPTAYNNYGNGSNVKYADNTIEISFDCGTLANGDSVALKAWSRDFVDVPWYPIDDASNWGNVFENNQLVNINHYAQNLTAYSRIHFWKNHPNYNWDTTWHRTAVDNDVDSVFTYELFSENGRDLANIWWAPSSFDETMRQGKDDSVTVTTIPGSMKYNWENIHWNWQCPWAYDNLAVANQRQVAADDNSNDAWGYSGDANNDDKWNDEQDNTNEVGDTDDQNWKVFNANMIQFYDQNDYDWTDLDSTLVSNNVHRNWAKPVETGVRIMSQTRIMTVADVNDDPNGVCDDCDGIGSETWEFEYAKEMTTEVLDTAKIYAAMSDNNDNTGIDRNDVGPYRSGLIDQLTVTYFSCNDFLECADAPDAGNPHVGFAMECYDSDGNIKWVYPFPEDDADYGADNHSGWAEAFSTDKAVHGDNAAWNPVLYKWMDCSCSQCNPMTFTVTPTAGGGSSCASYAATLDVDLDNLWTYRQSDGEKIFISNSSPVAGKGLDFDGNDDYLQVDDAMYLDIKQGISVSAWVYLQGTGKEQNILVKGNGNDYSYKLFVNNADQPVFSLKSASSEPLEGTEYNHTWGGAALAADTWYHVVGVYNGSSIAIYVDNATDGVNDSTVINAITLAQNDQPVYMGGMQNMTSAALNGRLDQVRLYDRAITVNEIASIYNNGNGKQTFDTISGLVGIWNFESILKDESATNFWAADESGNNYNAYLKSLGTTKVSELPKEVTGVVEGSKTNAYANGDSVVVYTYVRNFGDDNANGTSDDIAMKYAWYYKIDLEGPAVTDDNFKDLEIYTAGGVLKGEMLDNLEARTSENVKMTVDHVADNENGVGLAADVNDIVKIFGNNETVIGGTDPEMFQAVNNVNLDPACRVVGIDTTYEAAVTIRDDQPNKREYTTDIYMVLRDKLGNCKAIRREKVVVDNVAPSIMMNYCDNDMNAMPYDENGDGAIDGSANTFTDLMTSEYYLGYFIDPKLPSLGHTWFEFSRDDSADWIGAGIWQDVEDPHGELTDQAPVDGKYEYMGHEGVNAFGPIDSMYKTIKLCEGQLIVVVNFNDVMTEENSFGQNQESKAKVRFILQDGSERSVEPIDKNLLYRITPKMEVFGTSTPSSAMTLNASTGELKAGNDSKGADRAKAQTSDRDGWYDNNTWVGKVYVGEATEWDGISKLAVSGFEDRAGNKMEPVTSCFMVEFTTSEADVLAADYEAVDPSAFCTVLAGSEAQNLPISYPVFLKSDLKNLSSIDQILWSYKVAKSAYGAEPAGSYAGILHDSAIVVNRVTASSTTKPANYGDTLYLTHTGYDVDTSYTNFNAWLEDSTTFANRVQVDFKVATNASSVCAGADMMEILDIEVDYEAPALTIQDDNQRISDGVDYGVIKRDPTYSFKAVDVKSVIMDDINAYYDPAIDEEKALAQAEIDSIMVEIRNFSTDVYMTVNYEGFAPEANMWDFKLDLEEAQNAGFIASWTDSVVVRVTVWDNACNSTVDSVMIEQYISIPTMLARGNSKDEAFKSVNIGLDPSETLANEDPFGLGLYNQRSFWPAYYYFEEAQEFGAATFHDGIARVLDSMQITTHSYYNLEDPNADDSDPWGRDFTANTREYTGDELYIVAKNLSTYAVDPSADSVFFLCENAKDANSQLNTNKPIVGNANLHEQVITAEYDAANDVWYSKWVINDVDEKNNGIIRITTLVKKPAEDYDTLLRDYGFFMLDTRDPDYSIEFCRGVDASETDYESESERAEKVLAKAVTKVAVKDSNATTLAAPGDNVWVTKAQPIDGYIKVDQTVNEYETATSTVPVPGKARKWAHVNIDFQAPGKDNDVSSTEAFNKYHYLNDIQMDLNKDNHNWVLDTSVATLDTLDEYFFHTRIVNGSQVNNGFAYCALEFRDAAGNYARDYTVENSEGMVLYIDLTAPSAPDAEKMGATIQSPTGGETSLTAVGFGSAKAGKVKGLVDETTVTISGRTGAVGNGTIADDSWDTESLEFSDACLPTVKVYKGDAVVASGKANRNGSFTLSFVDADATEESQYQVTVTDIAGNESDATNVDASQPVTVAIQFAKAGWKMISVNVESGLEFGDMIDQSENAGFKNAFKYIYTEGDPEDASSVKSITDEDLDDPERDLINLGEELSSYWLFIDAPCTLYVEGLPIDAATDIELSAGINYVAYLMENDCPVYSAFDVDDDFKANVTAIVSQNWRVDVVDGEFSDSTIMMERTKGYWVVTSGACVVNYNPAACEGSDLAKVSVPFDNMDSDIAVSPNLTFFNGEVNFYGKPAFEGDVISVFDVNDVKCGEGVVKKDGTYSIVVYGDHEFSEVDEGADNGQKLIFKVNEQEVAAEVSANFKADMANHSLNLVVKKPLPKTFALHANVPNPFNPTTVISYDLPVESKVEVTIWNVLGQKVKTLVNGKQDAGQQKVVWDGTTDDKAKAASGIYFYKIKANDFTETKSMTMLK